MKKLSSEKRTQIVHLMVDGTSLRATSRLFDVSINTVTKLLVDVGRACQEYHDENVRNLTARRIQCDEIWSFVYAKKKTKVEGCWEWAGDVWVWVRIDADSKLAISWAVGNRDAECGGMFMKDIAGRLSHGIQLTSDGHHVYLEAVESAFGADIDFA